MTGQLDTEQLVRVRLPALRFGLQSISMSGSEVNDMEDGIRQACKTFGEVMSVGWLKQGEQAWPGAKNLKENEQQCMTPERASTFPRAREITARGNRVAGFIDWLRPDFPGPIRQLRAVRRSALLPNSEHLDEFC